MQRRHDRLTAAGFVVLHNSPSGLRDEPSAVLAEIERSFARWNGRGMPEGVEIVHDQRASRMI